MRVERFIEITIVSLVSLKLVNYTNVKSRFVFKGLFYHWNFYMEMYNLENNTQYNILHYLDIVVRDFFYRK